MTPEEEKELDKEEARRASRATYGVPIERIYKGKYRKSFSDAKKDCTPDLVEQFEHPDLDEGSPYPEEAED